MKTLIKYLSHKLFLSSAAVVLGVLLILNFFKMPDTGILLTHIQSIGYPVIIIFLPYMLIIINDSLGWFNSFARKPAKKFIGRLITLRLATESLQTSLPGGAAYAELVRPFLLNKYLKVEYTDGITANIVTKVNILAAQIIFLILGIILLLTRFSNGTPGAFIPGSLLYPMAFLLISGGILIAYLLYNKDLIMKAAGVLERINIKSLNRFIDRVRRPAFEINNLLKAFYNEHKLRLLMTIITFLVTWFLMALESLFILKVIGIDANLWQMVLLESLISLIRMMFFFLPGAAGPQDAAIIMIFTAAGIPSPVLNSIIFIMLKRAKEIVWIIIGYIVLLSCGIEMKKLLSPKKKEQGYQIKLAEGPLTN